jgi:NADPH:quinone reductase-like Zn-dependent oxidoreductase
MTEGEITYATQVRVRVMATGLNPADYVSINERRPTYPYAPGVDVAGVVDSIGVDVTGFLVGDRVGSVRLFTGVCNHGNAHAMLYDPYTQVYYHGDMKGQYGGFAEFALTTTATLRKIPDSMSFEGNSIAFVSM